jgi:hypothetical protein
VQIVLVDQLFGGRDGDFSGGGELVVFERGFAQLGAFFFGLDLVGHGIGLRCGDVLSGLPGFSRQDAEKGICQRARRHSVNIFIVDPGFKSLSLGNALLK